MPAVGVRPGVAENQRAENEVSGRPNPGILLKPYKLSRRYRQRDTGFPVGDRDVALELLPHSDVSEDHGSRGTRQLRNPAEERR